MRCPRLASVRPVGSSGSSWSVFQPHLHKEASLLAQKPLLLLFSPNGRGRKPTHSWVSYTPSIAIISPPVPPPKWARSWWQWWATARRARGLSWPHLYCLLPSGSLSSQPGHQHPSTPSFISISSDLCEAPPSVPASHHTVSSSISSFSAT